MKRIPTLSTNDYFRRQLTISEIAVWDTVKEKGSIPKQQLADELGMTVALTEQLYASAQEKFLKYATRSEM